MFTLKLKTDNAAFHESDKGEECARILEKIARKLREGYDAGRAADYNGNTVGQWVLK